MKKNTEKLFPERLYHIYNRGINGENLFKEARNYPYFLEKYYRFVLPVADLYAYCLMKNHFHLLIEIRTEDEIRAYYEKKIKNPDLVPIELLISKAFNSFFKSYSVTINKTYKRTGRLFEEPFLRVEVTRSEQITDVIKYIHHNPQTHGFVSDFRQYSHSSYHEFLNNEPTQLAKEKIISWFGSKADYKAAHYKDGEKLKQGRLISIQDLIHS